MNARKHFDTFITNRKGGIVAGSCKCSHITFRWIQRLLLCSLCSVTARAQQTDIWPRTSHADSIQWFVQFDQEEDSRPLEIFFPLDSLQTVGGALVSTLRNQGYYYAHWDSTDIDHSIVPPRVLIHVNRGPMVRIGEVEFTGLDRADQHTVSELIQTQTGTILETKVLEEDLAQLLVFFESVGFPLARVRIDEVGPIQADPSVLRLSLHVEKGPTVSLKRVELTGSERTKSSYVSKTLGLRPGRPLRHFDPVEMQRQLYETGVFRTVGIPELIVEPDTGAVIKFFIEEDDPGMFDLVLGYLPPATEGSSGNLIGNGHLALRNLFGRGRTFSLRLHRLPRQASSVDVVYREPFLFGLPFDVSGRFEGLQQDSTYGKQGYRGEVGYKFEDGLGTFVTYSREVTRPGQAGLRLAGGEQRIARADAWFAGLGIRFRRLDRNINPSHGWMLETNLESGRKDRSASIVVAQDTTLDRSIQRQKRLFLTARYYRPGLSRQVFVAGIDASLLLSKVYDQSDLFRFGGATSLRGYDEDFFLGRTVARALLEIRYQFERLSYAFVFIDAGYVERPHVVNLISMKGIHLGYGLGMLFSTNLGMVNVSAAFNPDDGPTGARIHAGLSFGL